MDFSQMKRICVITGHYGSGKTNIAINMAIDLKKSGKKVTIVDLDIVNPYFRTADLKGLLEEKGIRTILPTFAGTNLDIPSLPAEVNRIFDDEQSHVIVDVGGDDAGAIALGRYTPDFNKSGYDLFYVVNARRYLTATPKEAVELLKDIEAVSRLRATGIINNTNLGRLSDLKTLSDSKGFALEISKATGLPLICSALLREKNPANSGFYPVDIYVKSPWEDS